MAVKIRLSRHGAKKRPFYRVVVADQRFPRDGRYIEQVGTFNPVSNPKQINLDIEKIDEWVSKGAQLSDTVGHLVQIVRDGNKPAPKKTPKKSKKQLEKERAAQDEALQEAAAAEAAETEAIEEEVAAEVATEAPAGDKPAKEPKAEEEPAKEAKAEDKPAEEKDQTAKGDAE